MLLALGDRFKAFGIAHASLREIGEIGDGSDFWRRSGNGPTTELPPLRAHESGSRAPDSKKPHPMVVA